MSTLEVNTINPQSGTTITIGGSGDTVSLGSGATTSGFGGIFESQLLHVRDEKSSGTQGGTGTATAFNTRDLNTIKTNEITGASLSSNQITLPSGTYYAIAHAVTRRANENKVRLRNITDSSTTLVGFSERSASGDVTTTQGFVSGRFTIAAEKVFELQHYFTDIDGGSSEVKGQATASGEVEVYVDLQIWKVA